MDKYVVRMNSGDGPADLPPEHLQIMSSACPKASASESGRIGSLLSVYETRGRVLRLHKRSLLPLILGRYAEIGSIPQAQGRANDHDIRIQGAFQSISVMLGRRGPRHERLSASCLDFDSKGIYLASGHTNRCLAIHDFEALNCSAAKGSIGELGSSINYILSDKVLEAVRWNPANQDEVACVARGTNKVYFHDVTLQSFLPTEVLKLRSDAQVVGFHDVIICRYGTSRVLACGRDGKVHIWDRRASKLSCAALPVLPAVGHLNSLQLSFDEQVVYAGSEGGFIHAWDLRGGKRAAAFVSCAEEYHQPLGTVKLSALLSNITSLRAQTQIDASAVHAISLDPSHAHRMAFHLNNGWSGVLDLGALEITHLHCPPPPWLDDVIDEDFLYGGRSVDPGRRRPAWIGSHSVYAVPSASGSEIHLLDFTPGPKSRHSIDHDCSSDDLNKEQWQVNFPTSEAVVAVAVNPMNDQLVAGTMGGKLLLVGQKTGPFTKQDDTSYSPKSSEDRLSRV